jgi:hypothetical protein
MFGKRALGRQRLRWCCNIKMYMIEGESRDNVVGIAGRPRGRNSSPGGVKNFHFSKSSRPALGSTQPPIQWVLGGLSPG